MTYYWKIDDAGDFVLYQNDKETEIGRQSDVGNFTHSAKNPPLFALQILDTQSPDEMVMPVSDYE